MFNFIRNLFGTPIDYSQKAKTRVVHFSRDYYKVQYHNGNRWVDYNRTFIYPIVKNWEYYEDVDPVINLWSRTGPHIDPFYRCERFAEELSRLTLQQVIDRQDREYKEYDEQYEKAKKHVAKMKERCWYSK